MRQGSAQWLKPELRVRVKHLKAKGVLRHATVKQLISINAAAGLAKASWRAAASQTHPRSKARLRLQYLGLL
jgi:hypothetical protein